MTSSTYLGIAESVARRNRLPNADLAPFVLWLAPQLESPTFDWTIVDRWLAKRGLVADHADLVQHWRGLVEGTHLSS
ncbi:MAG: hypothetical protein FJW96_17805 [Actinobacteria bacterium]|nr:hypothetical protein [Actinomycetota bacterium]